jgi:sugar O-acyltransferase (sialic acid O-acetyltransferase NeuD family)
MGVQKVIVLGAGGMAREVSSLLRSLNRTREQFQFLGYVVTDLSRLTDRDSRAEVLGDYSWFTRNRDRVDAAILGIGTPEARLKVANDIRPLAPGLEWPALIHPSAILDSDTLSLGEGAYVGAGVVGTVNIVLEPFCLCNFGCTLGHEARIGRGSVINPGANISGGVTIGEGVLVGTGAQVLQYRSIGAHAVVGAGAVVTRDVKAGDTVLGIPAKPPSSPLFQDGKDSDNYDSVVRTT